MKHDQSTDYLTAFVVGALVGVGAALLFAPDPPTRRERIMKELKPYRKKVRKGTERARKAVSSRASAASEWTDELTTASRAIMKDLRAEVAELVADARDEIAATVEGQLETAGKAIRRGARRVRR